MELPVIVLYLTNDLLFSSRVSAVARSLGMELTVVGSSVKLREQLARMPAAAVLIDLEHRDAAEEKVAELAASLPAGSRSIAYGPHVKESLLSSAQAAGLDLVLTRGQFDQQIASLLKNLLATPL